MPSFTRHDEHLVAQEFKVTQPLRGKINASLCERAIILKLGQPVRFTEKIVQNIPMLHRARIVSYPLPRALRQYALLDPCEHLDHHRSNAVFWVLFFSAQLSVQFERSNLYTTLKLYLITCALEKRNDTIANLSHYCRYALHNIIQYYLPFFGYLSEMKTLCHWNFGHFKMSIWKLFTFVKADFIRK